MFAAVNMDFAARPRTFVIRDAKVDVCQLCKISYASAESRADFNSFGLFQFAIMRC